MTGRTYLEPRWPSESFYLLSAEGWTLGPFPPDGWGTGPSGEKVYADGAVHPVVLGIRGQDGDVIHANDGDRREMDYQIVPVSDPRTEPWG